MKSVVLVAGALRFDHRSPVRFQIASPELRACAIIRTPAARATTKGLSCLFLFFPVACRARSACGCALVNKCSASTFQEITHYTGRQRIIRAKSTRRASRLFTGRRVTTYKTTIWIAEEEGELRRNLYSPAAHPRWAKRARLQLMFFSQSSRQFVLASARSIR